MENDSIGKGIARRWLDGFDLDDQVGKRVSMTYKQSSDAPRQSMEGTLRKIEGTNSYYVKDDYGGERFWPDITHIDFLGRDHPFKNITCM